MKITKAERQLIALEKGLRNCRKMLTTMIREISPKSRHAVKDIKFSTSLKVKDREITTDNVIEALGSFGIKQGDSGWHVYPPHDKIHPTTWNRIRKVMADNGGNWMTQRQAFVFEEDPFPIFRALSEGTLANKKKDRQAFYTPYQLALKVVTLADVRGKNVLEPSAGEGALAELCVAHRASSVTCYEIDRHAFLLLRAKGYSASHCDFLDMITLPHYQRIVMNPPFAKKAYIKHIQHALKCLAPGGRLVAIIPGDMPPKALTKSLPVWSTWNCIPQEAGAFQESGTNVKTSILVINLDQNK